MKLYIDEPGSFLQPYEGPILNAGDTISWTDDDGDHHSGVIMSRNVKAHRANHKEPIVPYQINFRIGDSWHSV